MTQINLLPWREKRREERQQQFIVILVAVGVFAAFVGWLVNSYYNDSIAAQQVRNNFLSKEIRIIDEKIDEIKALRDTRQQLIERMELIQDLQGNRPIIVRIFDEVVRAIPDDLYLTSASVKGDSVTIKGLAKSNNRVSALMRNFDQSPWFADPALIKVNQKADGLNEFEVFLKRVEPDAEEETNNG